MGIPENVGEDNLLEKNKYFEMFSNIDRFEKRIEYIFKRYF